MRNLVILGSTGSVGTQTLEVVEHLSDDWKILALTANTSISLLEKQARKFKPLYLVVMNEKMANKLKYNLQDIETEVLTGMEGLEYVVSLTEADMVVNALVGAIGLRPSVAALKAGKKIGLANKESLVIGGGLINKLLQETGEEILPIDSEHHAIFQLLRGHEKKEVNKIILTASGGPFLRLPAEKLGRVTVEEALNHPNWEMGSKISIDSATLMNKGLEVIEAHCLFNQPYEKIEVVVHPESIIHSMVEFIDKSVKAELGATDMKMPIQSVLTYPKMRVGMGEELDLLKTGHLHFLSPDTDKFPALRLAYEAGRVGGTMPVVLNAANEVAVKAFLVKEISFRQIPIMIEKVLAKHNPVADPSLEEIFAIDEWARSETEGVLKNVINYY